MVDFKVEMGGRILAALVLAMITYALLSPVINAYANIISVVSCSSNPSISCTITSILLIIVVPIFAIFVCMWGILEAFYR